MLSTEFIPTSSSDEDFLRNNATSANSVKSFTEKSTESFNTNTNVGAVSAGKPLNFTTNPEGIKFVPQPPVQFYYSLQKNSLRTVIDTLLTTSEIGQVCTTFKVPCYGKWLKKKVAAEMLVDHMLTLKQAYEREKFNEIVEKINLLKGKAMLGRIPKLPEKVDALKVLKGSLELMNKVARPNFPVRLSSPLKEVTGLIFLDQVGEEYKNSFIMDLYFAIPPDLAQQRFILCIYQTSQKITTQTPNLTIPTSTVSPTLLDLTLNGSSLELGNCRFRNHDCYDITLICYKDRANLLRILRHETHIDLKNLIIEIVAINIAGSISEVRSTFSSTTTANTKLKRTLDEYLSEDETIMRIREKYLKEDENLIIKSTSFEESLNSLRKANNDHKSEEIEILEDTMKLSLKCPISFTRIQKPVKFKSCKHGQCFDLSSWKKLTENILNLRINSRDLSKSKKCHVRVSCPVCGTSVEDFNDEEFIIDGLFKNILESSELNDISIDLNLKNGTFTFIKDDNDDDLDLDDDNNLEDLKDHEYLRDNVIFKGEKTKDGVDVISIKDSDEDEETIAMLSYKADKSKPIGSCPSRAITLD